MGNVVPRGLGWPGLPVTAVVARLLCRYAAEAAQ